MGNVKWKTGMAVILAAASIGVMAGCGGRGETAQTGDLSSGEGQGAEAGGVAAGETQKAAEALGGRHLNAVLFWVSATLDPADGYNGWTLSRIGAGETLLRLDENANPGACLADSWRQDDENTWVFHIRENVSFSNGKAVDGEACRKAIQRAFDQNSRAFEYFVPESMEAKGQELTVRTARPSGAVLNNLCEPLFTIIDTDMEEAAIDQAPICTGPYVVEAFSPEARVELARNQRYWDGPTGLDSITVMEAADSDSRVMAMQSGEADLATAIDNTNLALFRDKEQYSVYEAIGPRVHVVYMNNKTGFLKDPAIRKALSYAADCQTYADLTGGEKAAGLYSAALACGRGLTDPYGWNPQKAAEILDGRGYVDTDHDGIREKDGQNIVLRYYISPDHGSGDGALIAQALQADAGKAGIGVELVQAENLADVKSSHSFDLCSANDSTAPTGDPEVFLALHYETGAPANYGEYSNEEVDRMTGSLKETFGLEERQFLAREISQKILDDAACLYVSCIYENTVAAKKVKNVRQFPMDYYIITKDITVE